ncbi:hypothetical protein MIR68_001364 [Amoeboaphelidium protococcarum]|nr:hypothetical protein MIR68_001364 [Amoeboaphelidium protococcarum]
MNVTAVNTQNDIEVVSPPGDGISSISFSPVAEYMCVTSWDNTARFWEISPNGQTNPKLQITHEAPLLCSAFSSDGSKVFVGGASPQQAQTGAVGGFGLQQPAAQASSGFNSGGGKLVDLATGQSIPFATQHTAPIKSCAFATVSNMQNVLITGSWDKTVKFFDIRQPGNQPLLSLNMPERVFCMDVAGQLMTVATAERHVLMYNLGNPNTVYKQQTSPLKFQTKSIANFTTNNSNGYALGSVEGRVAIQYIEDKDVGRNFTFKCHRSGNDVYSVNAISFHPVHGTFTTAGADGVITFWDKDVKQRIKPFPNLQSPVACTQFNRNGTIFAYALSYDWSKGHEHYKPNEQRNRILLHATQDDEVKPKSGVKK